MQCIIGTMWLEWWSVITAYMYCVSIGYWSPIPSFPLMFCLGLMFLKKKCNPDFTHRFVRLKNVVDYLAGPSTCLVYIPLNCVHLLSFYPSIGLLLLGKVMFCCLVTKHQWNYVAMALIITWLVLSSVIGWWVDNWVLPFMMMVVNYQRC